jgi:transcriptional regulator with XRE-family HTH domain
MSQEALAKALGLTFQQIQKYEKGMNRIGVSHDMAGVLDVPIDYFYQGLPDARIAPGAAHQGPALEFLALPDSDRLMRCFLGLHDPGGRRKVVEIVEWLALRQVAALVPVTLES